MGKKYFILLGLLLLLMIGCDSKSQRFVFDEETHILKKIITFHSKDTTSYEFCGYYDNGQIEAQGFYHKDKKEGKWTFWFKDGVEKYTANYENGISNLDHRYRPIPQILLDEPLEIGKTTYFKVQNLYGWDALWISDNAELDFSDDENYIYTITPLSEGPIYFYYHLLESVSINKEKYKEYSQLLDISIEDMPNTRFYKFEKIILNPLEKTVPETFNTSSTEGLNAMEEYKAYLYYPNGDVNSIGYIRNMKRDGYWISYYEDQGLRREMIYHDGQVRFDRTIDYPHIQHFDSVRLLVPQKIRVINLLPGDEIEFSDNVIFTKLDNDPMYDYEITPISGDTITVLHSRKYLDDTEINNPSVVYYTSEDKDCMITEILYTARIPIYGSLE